jgi:hypothetical protein
MGNMICCCKAREKEPKTPSTSIPDIFEKSFSNDDIIGSPKKTGVRKSILKTSEILKHKNSSEGTIELARETSDGSNNVDRDRKISFCDFNTFSEAKGATTDDVMTTKATMSSKSFAQKYYLKVVIEHLELYNKCDNFGYYFKPFLEICLDNTEPVVIKQNEEDISNTSDLDMTSNTSTNLTANKLSTSICLKKEKTVAFKYQKVYELKPADLYNFLTFKLKSEALKDLEVITVAESSVPLIMLFNHYRNIPFDGNIELSFRCNTFIGYLKVNLSLSENSNTSDVKGMIQKAKFFEEYDDKNNADDTSAQIRMLMNVWEHNYINLDDLYGPAIDQFFFITDSDMKEQFLQQSLGVPRKFEPKIDAMALARLFNQFVRTNGANQLALYQLLMLLVKITEKDQCQLVINFFRLLKTEDIDFFYDIPCLFHSNPFIVKYYLILFNNLLKYYKNAKVRIDD